LHNEFKKESDSEYIFSKLLLDINYFDNFEYDCYC